MLSNEHVNDPAAQGQQAQRQQKDGNDGTGRFHAIDALRGLACLGVLLHHLYRFPCSEGLFAGQDLPTRAIRAFASRGWLGVDLFLVLSGFCLFYPVVRQQIRTGGLSLNLSRFFLRRAGRILPPYYAALALGALSPLLPTIGPLIGSLPSSKSVIAHVLLLHNLHPHTIGTINASFWSLALEAQLYLAFPFLVLLVRQGGLRLLLGVTLAISVLWQVGVFLVMGMHPSGWEIGGVFFHAVPGRCFEFAAGMAAAAVVARPLRPRQMGITVGLGLAFFAIGLRTANISRYGPHNEPAWAITFACLVIASCRLIPAAWFERRTPLALLSGLGVISYSVYLLHQWLISVANTFVPQLPPANASLPLRALLGCAVVGALIGVGYVFFLAVERPTLRRRKSAASVGVVPATPIESKPIAVPTEQRPFAS